MRSRFIAACLTAALLTACSSGGSMLSAPQAPNGTNASSPSSASRFLKSTTGTDDSPITYEVRPLYKLAQAVNQKPAQLPTPSQCEAIFGTACYTPPLIRAGYNVPGSLDGSGQTIVIVDAFGSPTIRQDLQLFDLIFGLPDPTLNIIFPVGQPPPFDLNNANMVSWASETSLDVEWAHAIAPGATIDLLIAPTNHGNPLDLAVSYAVRNHLGTVISQSFGSPEAAIRGNGNNLQLMQADKTFVAAQAAGITVLASSGDFGASNGFSVANASFPASDPLVTAVGGTDLFLSDAGAYQSETVWNDSDPATCPFGCTLPPSAQGSTGGAPSVVFAAPAYQQALSHQSARTTSDVAYNASVYTAILVLMSFLPLAPGGPPEPALYFFGGTSEGAPQWAGIVALAAQSKGSGLGLINPKLYAIGANRHKYAADFHDVTVGNNAFFGPGFSAGTGYDLPTGLGSPNVSNLISDLTH